MRNPEKHSDFFQSCSVLGLNPRTNTTFDWLEADDRRTFRAKPMQPLKQEPVMAAVAPSNNGQPE